MSNNMILNESIKHRYIKEFILRGLIFSCFGPIILGIVYFILDKTGTSVNLSGSEVFIAILTTTVIAFVHAGSSIFPAIESWSVIKSMFFQGISLYTVYTVGYLINSWIPLNGKIILIYTIIFIAVFVLIWVIVLLASRAVSKKMNKMLELKQKQLSN